MKPSITKYVNGNEAGHILTISGSDLKRLLEETDIDFEVDAISATRLPEADDDNLADEPEANIPDPPPAMSSSHDSENSGRKGATGSLMAVFGNRDPGGPTIAQTLLHQVANEGLYDADYIFYLKFVNIDFENEMNLLELLAHSIDLPWVHDEEKRNSVLEEVLNSNKVVLIMDGFDQEKIELDTSLYPKVNPFGRYKADAFIVNILRGDLLVRAKKIITSKPRGLGLGLELKKTRDLIQIFGQDTDRLQYTCENLCGERHSTIYPFIEDRPELFVYCCLPSNSILLMVCINYILKQNTDITELTLTDVILIISRLPRKPQVAK